MAMGKKTGGGLRTGKPNKNTAAIKEMVLGALQRLGGEAWLVKQANQNPGPFMQLLGKIMPLQVTGANGNPIETITRIERLIVDPAAAIVTAAIAHTAGDDEDVDGDHPLH